MEGGAGVVFVFFVGNVYLWAYGKECKTMETLIVRYPPGIEAVLLQSLGELSKLGVRVETSSEKNFERIPGLPYANEERIVSVRSAMADYRAGGRTYSIEELQERMAKW